MSIHFKIDRKARRKVFAVSDNFRFPDFFQAWRQSLLHPDHAPDQAMVWDLTDLDTTCLLESDLQRIAQFMQGQSHVEGRIVDVALIAPTKATFGLASTYLHFILDDQDHFAIFRNLAAADQWLNRQHGESESQITSASPESDQKG